MPKISIVIPVYNGERYLREAIESVLSQTLTDWELILVNDCSEDGSLSIMESYQDSRIRIINNISNQHLPRSLNNGFRVATGEYLTWSSDDNRYGENALLHMAQKLDADQSCGLVYEDMYYIDENGQVVDSVSSETDMLYVYNVIGACFLYRREIMQTVGEYNPDMVLVEDYDYWIRIAKKYQICHLGEKDYFYRRHKKSLTETKRIQIAHQLERLRIRELPFLLSSIKCEYKKYLFIDMALQGDIELAELAKIFYKSHLPSDLRWLWEVCEIEEIQEDWGIQTKFILCGAGNIGKQTLLRLGEDRVAFFADNNPTLAGKEYLGKKVVSFSKTEAMYEQLKGMGISQIIYCNKLRMSSGLLKEGEDIIYE